MYDNCMSENEAEGAPDERGIFITEAGKERARRRRLEAEAKISPEDSEALRERYGLRKRPA